MPSSVTYTYSPSGSANTAILPIPHLTEIPHTRPVPHTARHSLCVALKHGDAGEGSALLTLCGPETRRRRGGIGPTHSVCP